MQGDFVLTRALGSIVVYAFLGTLDLQAERHRWIFSALSQANPQGSESPGSPFTLQLYMFCPFFLVGDRTSPGCLRSSPQLGTESGCQW